MTQEKAPNIVNGETCPFCSKKTLTLMENEQDIPFFGKVFIFSMNCSSCKYHKADVEKSESQEPSKYTIEIESEEDLSIRIVKSAQATVKIPRVTEIIPGPGSNGYITNAEGIINRIKKQIENVRDNEAESPEAKKKAKNLVKKLQKVLWGQEKIKIIVEDPSGNSAIISEKAKKEKLKGKK